MGLTGISNDSKPTTRTEPREAPLRHQPAPPSAPVEKPLSDRSRHDLGSLGGVSSFDATPAAPAAETELAEHARQAPGSLAAPAVPAGAVSQPELVERARHDLGSLGGVSTFDATPAGPARPVSPAELTQSIDLTTIEVSRATKALETANATVQKHEETLAKELAQLAPVLTTEELQTYADHYRADHGEDYQAAEAAAGRLGDVLRDRVPGALEAAAPSQNLDVRWANSHLVDKLDDAAAALGQYVAQSPTGDDALQRSLTQTVDRLSVVSTATGGASVALEGVSHLTTTLSDLSRTAGNAFGIVSAGAALASAGGRIADGTGRTEHYVGAAVSVAELGIGVAAVAGVTVGLPVTATLAAVGTVAGLVSNARDRAELERSTGARLRELGYSDQLAESLSTIGPKTGNALREAGYSVEDIRSLVMLAPDLADSGELDRLAEVTRGLGLQGDQMMEMIEGLGPSAADVVLEMHYLSIEAQTMGLELDRQTMVGLLRRNGSVPGFEDAAAFLERLGN